MTDKPRGPLPGSDPEAYAEMRRILDRHKNDVPMSERSPEERQAANERLKASLAAAGEQIKKSGLSYDEFMEIVHEEIQAVREERRQRDEQEKKGS